MACAFCRDQEFLDYLQSIDSKHYEWTEQSAKSFILLVCQVESRNELDANPAAAQRFHKLVRGPYMKWREQRRIS